MRPWLGAEFGYLRSCVTSILTQGVKDLRILIIDNCSTDDSVAVARQLSAEDPRVQVVAHVKNVGPTASYNEGIEWASAEYFMLLDADDLLAPGCIARALEVMEARPEIGFAYGFEALLYPDGSMHEPQANAGDAEWQVISGRAFIESVCRSPTCFVGAPTVLRRTAAQKRAGYYRPELPYTDDLEMWLRLATAGSVASTGMIQGIRRVHALQMSSDYRKSMVRDFRAREDAFESFFTNEGRALPDSARLQAHSRRNLGAHAYWSAISHLFRGYPSEALQLIGFSLSRRPSAALLPPISWLLRMHRPLARLVDVLLEAGLRAPQKKMSA
jgi:glycosyltransferase involved in cell wall biosynthesis